MRPPHPIAPTAAARLLRLAGLLLAFVAPDPSAAHPASPLPAFVQEVAVPLEARPPEDFSGSSVYWLLSDVQEDRATLTTYYHHASRVLAEAGLSEASGIEVVYEPSYQRVLFHRIILWRGGRATEMLARLKPTELRREEGWDQGMLDGRKTLLFALEGVRVGDVVEYAYSIRGENPIFAGRGSGSVHTRFGVPVERMSFRLLPRPDRPVRLSARNGAPEPARARAGGELTWSRDGIPALRVDDDAPAWYDPYPRVQWSEYESWADVARWAVDLYRTEGRLSPELEAVARGLRGLPPRERVARALRLVQEEVRYLGLEMGPSSHRPAHPDLVYRRRFGDCKDKALLLCALLRRSGVESAVPVLVNSRMRGTVADYLPSPFAFDHVIARVEVDGRKRWFDATLQHQRGDPFDAAPPGFGTGLPVAPGVEALEAIPQDEPQEPGIRLSQEFRVPSVDSAASLEVVSVYAGAEADAVRAFFAGRTREDISEDYLNYYAKAYPRIRQAAPLRYEDDASGNRVTVREAYLVDSLCGPEAGTGRMACGIHPQEVAQWAVAPERRIRTSPYPLAYPKSAVQEVVLRMPEGMGESRDSGGIVHPDMRYSWVETVQDSTVRLVYTYEARADHVPLERFPAYLSALDTVGDNLGATLYLGGGAGVLARLNYLMLLVAAASAAGGAWAVRKLLRLRVPPVPILLFSPRPLGGALWLLSLTIVVRPLAQAYHLKDVMVFFDLALWNALTLPGQEAYHPLWAPVILLELAAGIVLVCAGFALWPLFFGKRATFPKAFLWVFGSYLVLLTADTFAVRLFPENLMEREEGDLGTWARELIVGLLWLAYLGRSTRVAETFVHPLPAVASFPPADPPGELPRTEADDPAPGSRSKAAQGHADDRGTDA